MCSQSPGSLHPQHRSRKHESAKHRKYRNPRLISRFRYVAFSRFSRFPFAAFAPFCSHLPAPGHHPDAADGRPPRDAPPLSRKEPPEWTRLVHATRTPEKYLPLASSPQPLPASELTASPPAATRFAIRIPRITSWQYTTLFHNMNICIIQSHVSRFRHLIFHIRARFVFRASNFGFPP
jgi:hypothetical protein